MAYKGAYTDDQGRVRPIAGDSGGGGGKGSGKFAAAVVVAVAVAAFGGTTGGGMAGLTSATEGAVESSLSQSVRAKVRNAEKSAKRGQRTQTWRKLGFREVRDDIRTEVSCIARSFGEVREFFVKHRCRSMKRALFVLADGQGNTAALSMAWVGMPSTRLADKLDRLDYRHGTGDIATPGAAVLADSGVVFNGEHYSARSPKNRFVRAEATPMSGSPDAELLDGVVLAAKYLPTP